MTKDSAVENDLASIRDMMERSTKFISLSGMSGVLAGIFGLLGSGVAWFILYRPGAMNEETMLVYLVITAAIVLLLSLTGVAILTIRKARRSGQPYWNHNARRLTINMGIPLVAGGIFILMLIAKSYFEFVAPASLLFYGLALINASNFTLTDVRYLGICEIILGLLCTLFPAYGLFFWASGFGVLHIVYGTVMYNKYDK